MKLTKYLVLTSVLLSACGAPPVQTKTEAMQRVKESYEISGNYADVSEYWDMNGKKCSLDYGNITQLVIKREKYRSDIVFTNGSAVYGMIELIGNGPHKTKVVVYSWGSLNCVEDVSDFLKLNFKVLG